MTQITFPGDVTGAIQITHGSDGRLNVSARSDERIFYNSRDVEQTYIWASFDNGAAVNEYTIYVQNTSTTDNLIIKEVLLSPGVAMTFKISTVTGTAGGSAITGYNLNRNSGNAASANAFGDALVSGLTEDTVITVAMVPALETVEVAFHDALILGQNDNIAVECDVNTGGLVYMQVIGYFE